MQGPIATICISQTDLLPQFFNIFYRKATNQSKTLELKLRIVFLQNQSSFTCTRKINGMFFIVFLGMCFINNKEDYIAHVCVLFLSPSQLAMLTHKSTHKEPRCLPSMQCNTESRQAIFIYSQGILLGFRNQSYMARWILQLFTSALLLLSSVL